MIFYGFGFTPYSEAGIRFFKNMAYTYATIESRVRANVNSATAAVSGVIDDAVNYLSNFFHLKKIDTSKSTVAGQNYIAKPTNCLGVLSLKIGDDYYDRIAEKDIEEVEEWELLKYLERDDDKIYIWETPTAIAAAVIHYKAGFTAMAGAGSTDVPDRLVPILIVIATWLYWLNMAADVHSQRELFPDMTPEEVRGMADNWRKQFVQMTKLVKKEQ